MAPFSLPGRLRAAALSRRRFKSKAKHGRNRKKSMQESFERMKSEVEEISEDQKDIREGQILVKSKCEELKRETRLILLKSARTQFKLALIFRILKARESGDSNTNANLTEMLRDIVRREKKKQANC